MGLVTYKKEINKYGDLTPEEFLDLYKLVSRSPKLYNVTMPNNNIISLHDKDDKDSETLDWREKGAVTPVKDQGTCGACWIFSAIGVLEGFYFRTHNKLVSLSEQNMVDCISSYTCVGGWPPLALYYVQYKGISAEDNYYPYEAKHVKCRYAKSNNVNITFTHVAQVNNSENELKAALTRFGPIVISICATSTWRFYKSGVWYEKECCEPVNHSVLLVGYGTENGNDYWLVKNSMGPDWGEYGYMKIARNKHHNYCGLTSYAYYIY
ncbi:hypothetical protein NQ314_009332 [Rhamnusium bicolor]|uniref:Peptidase C1A papain C-terminal domain-containing protein n=1 Tax=Rhamnusium bicolor TaxID=1586634 RepID=A0AAV8Y210_9CUCU|nr:hypothetical protein NQ314_009332 [Rhamnusium bicolor]